MSTLANPLVFTKYSSSIQLSHGVGSSLKPMDQFVGSLGSTNLSFSSSNSREERLAISRRALSVQAAYRDDGRSSSANMFVGGFVLGGLIICTLGFVYAPQINKALAGTDKKDLMKKLPKFIYDEEKALEKTRKLLAEKIAQLNAAIDDVSAQLKPDDSPDGVAVNSDEVEALI